VYVSDFSTMGKNIVDRVESKTFFDFGVGGYEEVKERKRTEEQECGDKSEAA
jgi:hypothetical protein